MADNNRLRFVLDGDDRLSRVLNTAGDSANRLHRRIDAAVTNSSIAVRRLATNAGLMGRGVTAGANQSANAVRRFTVDANGRLRDLRGRYLTAAQAARALAGDTRGLPDALNNVASSAGRAAASMDTGGGGLGGAMKGVAGIAGLSLLPALGAIVPMAAGAGVAMGTLKLGFKGVGEAAALASEDKKKYKEALKKLSPEARSFTKELVGLKGRFGEIGKDIQKVMLPGFTKALKDSGPLVKMLGSAMTVMGKGFGDAAAGAGRLMKDSGFQKDFSTVLKLGGVFVKDLTSGLGGLARGFLSFGAASGPTLKALSGGIRDLLGKGLVGMFQGLETGIGGTAKFLDGFFQMLNTVLPALGRFAGEAARTFGPILGELAISAGQRATAVLDTLGGALRFLAPIFKDLAYGVQATTQLFAILLPTIKDTAGAILGSLIPAGSKVDEMKGPFQRLSEAVERNKGAIQEAARIGANGILDLVETGVTYLPELMGAFRSMATNILYSLDVIVSGAAASFGWIPGIGDKLKAADREFDKFKGGFLRGLAEAEQGTHNFSETVLPKLQQNRLKMNISNWQSQISTAKGQLKTVPPEKRAKLLANITDLQNKVASAKRQLNSIDGKTAHTWVITHLQARREGSHGTQLGYASGGLVRGPGTSTSDSVPVMLSDGEFVIRAASARRIGLDRLNALNAGAALAAKPAPRRQAVALPAPVQRPAAAPVDIAGQVAAAMGSAIAQLAAALSSSHGQPVTLVVQDGPTLQAYVDRRADGSVRRYNGQLVSVLNAGGGM